MKRKRALLAGVLALLLALSSVPALANLENDLRWEQNYINQLREEVEANLDHVSAEYAEALEVLWAAQVAEEEAQAQLDAINNQLAETEAQLAETQAELEATEAELNAHLDALGKRVRAMYEDGQGGLLQIMLGADDFNDFLDRVDFVDMILQQDAKLIEQVKEAQAKVEAQKELLEAKKADFLLQQAAAETLRNQLAEAAEAKRQAAWALEAEKERLANQLDELERKSAELADRIAALQRQRERPAGQLAFIYPGDSTLITSDFGMRIHPITGQYKGHTGTDFNGWWGGNVYASESGTVIISSYGWNGGYGNYIVIDHGGGYSTLYAHNSELLVSVGQEVTQGQVIAKVGSTGMSTGPHIHFEIRINGDPVNPMDYLP